MKIILFVFLSVALLPLGNTVFAETLEEKKINSEIAKLDAEAKKLNLEINALENPPKPTEPSEFQQSLITSIITVVGSVIGISATAGYAWYRSKMIVPLSDQEKLFRNYVKKDLSSQYKIYWDIIRNDVLRSNVGEDLEEKMSKSIPGDPENPKPALREIVDERLKLFGPRELRDDMPKTLDDYWKIISNRDFPENLHKKIREAHFDNVKAYINLYNIGHLKQKKSETDEKYKERITALADSLTKTVHSDYYEMVEKVLPKLVTIAVTTSKPSADKLKADPYSWNRDSLEKLKWLMILNGISEYEKTVEFLIDYEIQTQKNKSAPTKYGELLVASLRDLKERKVIDDKTFEKLMKLFEK